MKKKFLIYALIAAVAIHWQGVRAQPVLQHGQLQVKGTRLCNASGNPVALHGVSFGWHNLWPRFYNSSAVHELVDGWKATVVRASMGIELNDKGYLKNAEASAKLVQTVVDACIAENVYVIVDWHDHNMHQQEAVAFFENMAKRYGSYPHVIWEIFNEPDYETWPEIKAYSIAVIEAIRRHDPDNIILVGSPKWDQSIHEPAADPITGFKNLMYTMHFYAATHKQWLRDRTDSAIQKGLPIFVSECAGMEATGNGPIDEKEWQAFKSWMDMRQLSWVAWSLSDKNETCSMLLPEASSSGNWKPARIKPWGKMVQVALAAYPQGAK